MFTFTEHSTSSPGQAALISGAESLQPTALHAASVSDCVWLTDNFSAWFTACTRPDKFALDGIIADYMVMTRLKPLILAGVIRFRSPYFSVCQHCLHEFNAIVSAGTEKLVATFANEFHVKRTSDGSYNVETGASIEPQMIYSGRLGKSSRPPTRKAFARRWIRRELYSALLSAREASLTGGAVFSNSRIALAGLAQQNGSHVDARTIALLDKERELVVPWVSHLNAEQIVQLRHEASSALPAFREKLCRAMSASYDSLKISAAIADLREQAQEVRSELAAKNRNAARYWKTTYGVLGLALSAYGVASDQVGASLGGLLPIIQLLIGHKTGIDTDISKATSKPGFVFVKAQDILDHAH